MPVNLGVRPLYSNVSKHENYTSLGAIVGGAFVGFIVFGYLSMKLLDGGGSFLFVGIVAVSGAVIGGWFQLRHGDLLWHRLAAFFRWWQ